MYCVGCGKQLRDDVLFCTACGAKAENLQEHGPAVLPVNERAFTHDIGKSLIGEKLKVSPIGEDEKMLLRALIGPNSDYYIEEFQKIEKGIESLSSPSIIHAVYRKIYAPLKDYAFHAVALFTAAVIILILGALFDSFLFDILFAVVAIISFLFYLKWDKDFNTIYSNFTYQYLLHLRSLIATYGLTPGNMNTPEARRIIRGKGGVSILNAVIGVVISLIIIVLLVS